MKKIITAGYKKIAKEKNEYAICTESIGKTEGTNERSKWSEDAKERYKRCLKHVDPKEHGKVKEKKKESSVRKNTKKATVFPFELHDSEDQTEYRGRQEGIADMGDDELEGHEGFHVGDTVIYLKRPAQIIGFNNMGKSDEFSHTIPTLYDEDVEAEILITGSDDSIFVPIYELKKI